MKIHLLLLCSPGIFILSSCVMPGFGGGGGDAVTVTLNNFGTSFFFDGPCFPDTFNVTATLGGETSRVTYVVYDLVIRGPGGTHFEINGDLASSASIPGFYSRIVSLGSELGEVSEDELTGEFSVRALESSGATIGQADQTLTLRRCGFEEAMNIRPEISTRDVYYGPSCSSSVTHTVTISRSTPLPAGINMTAYWLAENARGSGRSADVLGRSMTFRDITTVESIFIYEFSDTLAITEEFVGQVDGYIGPLNLAGDPIFILGAVYELSGREGAQRLANSDRITIAVHPCSMRPMPTATAAPTETFTPTPVPTVLPTKKPAGGGGGSGGSSCSLSEAKCSAQGLKFDQDKCECVK
jgi:hypothetical protein